MGAPGGDVDDYQTGIGIFMRYLKDCWLTDQETRDFLIQQNYVEFVRVNADHAINEFDKNPKGNDLTNLTNYLSIFFGGHDFGSRALTKFRLFCWSILRLDPLGFSRFRIRDQRTVLGRALFLACGTYVALVNVTC